MSSVALWTDDLKMTSVCVQVFAEKMGLETGWNCHISLTPNGESPCDGAQTSPGHVSLHGLLTQGTKPLYKNSAQLNILNRLCGCPIGLRRWGQLKQQILQCVRRTESSSPARGAVQAAAQCTTWRTCSVLSSLNKSIRRLPMTHRFPGRGRGPAPGGGGSPL